MPRPTSGKYRAQLARALADRTGLLVGDVALRRGLAYAAFLITAVSSTVRLLGDLLIASWYSLPSGLPNKSAGAYAFLITAVSSGVRSAAGLLSASWNNSSSNGSGAPPIRPLPAQTKQSIISAVASSHIGGDTMPNRTLKKIAKLVITISNALTELETIYERQEKAADQSDGRD